MMQLRWRQPEPPIALRWRGPDDAMMEALARDPETQLAAIVGPPGENGAQGVPGPAGNADDGFY